MAILTPSFENINRLKVPPTDGELHLLEFLCNNLDDKYEIYFQPFINGDTPDIILMRKNSGVLIIEVKDWDLNNYDPVGRLHWELKKNKALIKSPLRQVQSYKDNLYDLHIEHLLEKKIKKKGLFGVVGCAVYFHHEDESKIRKFLWQTDLKFFRLIGRDTLTKSKFAKILRKQRLDKEDSKLFDEDLYNSFTRFLKPSIHTIEQGVVIRYTNEQGIEIKGYTKRQSELIESKPIQQKIKGFAGSGKTIILAKRAVNSHIRTGKRVLILTYNITLKNYIHDKISDVREEFEWDNFYITNYHTFFNTQLNNLGTPFRFYRNLSEGELSDYLDGEYYSNENIFEDSHDRIKKYDSIFIDEVQDYKTEWLKIIKEYFLAPDGELVVYGDEKQNIYERQLDADRKPNTGIPGRWNILDESFRMTKNIADLAIEYQKVFFAKKYGIDTIQIMPQTKLFYIQGSIEYYFFDSKLNRTQIFEKIISLIKNSKIHPNDISVQSQKVDILRELESFVKDRLKQKTKTNFETEEEWKKFSRKTIENKRIKSETIENIRRNRKFNFWMNPGFIKVSTIHSFKGWEIPTLFLIIESDNESDGIVSEELIYTAITRCRAELYILNINNTKYHKFFTKNVHQSHIIE